MLRSLHAVSAVAAACGYAVTAGSFLAGPHHELGVALLKSKYLCNDVVAKFLRWLPAVTCHRGLESSLRNEAE